MRILIVSPHADDETLGCGGMIARRADEGHEVHVVVAAISAVARLDGVLKNSAEQRRAEFEQAVRRLGVKQHVVLYEEHENRLDTLPQIELISRLEALLDENAYDQVFLPLASHHQDHRAVFGAATAALRERGRTHRESLVAAYEYAYAGWSPDPLPGGRLYVDVTGFLERKLDALRAYESQLREPPHPVSLEAVTRLAALRGVEGGMEHAELFRVLRMRA